MKLTLKRILSNGQGTLGTLEVNGLFCAFTCEDPAQTAKIAGKTRIPAGTYKIKLRESSPMANRYARRYPGHKGMLWLQDVPGFEYVYIHIGNTPKDTQGCVLVGLGVSNDAGGVRTTRSRDAYQRLYPVVLDALERDEAVYIEVQD